jgi:hypothetical protein
LHDGKRPGDFLLDLRESGFKQRLLWIDHYIHGEAAFWPLQANGFAQSPLHTVPIHCATQNPAYREPDPQVRGLYSRQVEDCHVSGEVPPSLFVHAFEICVAKQAQTPGEPTGTGQIDAAIQSDAACNHSWNDWVQNRAAISILQISNLSCSLKACA